MRGAGKRLPTPDSLISAATAPAYSYLLGLYLGDGYLAPPRRGVYQLRIYLDSMYPGIVREAVHAISALLPQNRPKDIMRIFCDHLDRLGIRWTMSSPDTAQIAQRESVLRVDDFVGPKR
jgi:hypothetical protein